MTPETDPAKIAAFASRIGPGTLAALNPHRVRLAARLRELRTATGLSGNRFAAHIGWDQSRVSKLETGAQLPTDEDLRTWVAATSQGPSFSPPAFRGWYRPPRTPASCWYYTAAR
ncbi:MAG: helix-turn-helix domain-containing protein [Pseudonocardiales bacterium]